MVASGGTVTIGSTEQVAGGGAEAKAKAEAAAEVAAITTDTATIIAGGIRIIGATPTRRETVAVTTIVVINNIGAATTSKVRMTSMVSSREAQIGDGGSSTLPGKHLRQQTVTGATVAAEQRQNSEKG